MINKKGSISRRDFLGMSLAAATITIPFAGNLFAQSSKRKPNLLFILADDLGWRDTTPYGSTFYKTPNIERLSKQGMLFTQAYSANPLCAPTRASIMTGFWPSRIGLTLPVAHMKNEVLEEKLVSSAPADKKALEATSVTRLKGEYYTLAEALKDDGYATGHFGKWHLGTEPYDPLHQGFDVDIPHYPGSHAPRYLAPWKFPASLNFTGEPGEHVEDRMAKEAVKFMTDNKDKPFFLNYWAFSVHSPWQAKADYVSEFEKTADMKAEQKNALYAAMVKSLDDAVGTLLKTLDDLKLTNDTIIIFYSDNGGASYYEEKMKTFANMDIPPTNNSPLRAGKGSIYEGGTRVPAIFVWPGVIPAGTTSEVVTQTTDLYPTILEMLGIKQKPDIAFDGMSIIPALKEKPFDRGAIFCHLPHYINLYEGEGPAVYVRKGDFKLIRFFCDNEDQTDRIELYDLKNDLSEKNNLVTKMPEKAKELNVLIDTFLKDSAAVIPTANPSYKKVPKP